METRPGERLQARRIAARTLKVALTTKEEKMPKTKKKTKRQNDQSMEGEIKVGTRKGARALLHTSTEYGVRVENMQVHEVPLGGGRKRGTEGMGGKLQAQWVLGSAGFGC
jgi:hypothetical protein